MESPIESDFNDYGPTALAYSSAVPQSLVGRAEPDWIAGFEESKKTNGQSAGLKKPLYLPVPQQMAKPPRKEAPNLTPSQPRPNGKNSIDLRKDKYAKELEWRVIRARESFYQQIREKEKLKKENEEMAQLLQAAGIPYKSSFTRKPSLTSSYYTSHSTGSLSESSGNPTPRIAGSPFQPPPSSFQAPAPPIPHSPNTSGANRGLPGPFSHSGDYHGNAPQAFFDGGEYVSQESIGMAITTDQKTPSILSVPQVKQHGGIFSDHQVLIKFVYDLEHVCVDHKNLMCTRGSNSNPTTLSGHSLMITCPTDDYYQRNPHDHNYHRMPDIPAEDLVDLIQMSYPSYNTVLAGGELAPIQGLEIIQNHERAWEITLDDFRRLTKELLKYMNCYGFGATLPTHALYYELDKLFTRKDQERQAGVYGPNGNDDAAQAPFRRIYEYIPSAMRLAGYGSIPANARDSYGDTLGGFGSAIAIDHKSWRKLKNGTYTGKLYAIPDRGWYTVSPFMGTLNYQNRIHTFAISFTPAPDATATSPSPPNLHLSYQSTLLLTDPLGNPTTGLDADLTGGLTIPNFPLLPSATYTGNGFGQAGSGGRRISIDAEGLVLNNDGSYWISDEYGPYIYRFSASGKLLTAIAPPPAYIPRRNKTISFTADSPPVYEPDRAVIPSDPESGRSNNQGLEGLTASPDGKTLYALTQSALINDGGPDNPFRRQARLLEYDVSRPSNPTLSREYVVTLPLWTDPTEDEDEQTKVAAQSEIHYLGGGQFFILARDSGAGGGQDSSTSIYRHIDVFDISSATNIKSADNDAIDGSIASDEGVLEPGVEAATYCSFLDFNVNSELARFGLRNGGEQGADLLNEKWESIAVVPADGKKGNDGVFFVFSLSDNDFITQDGYLNNGQYRYTDESGFDLDNQALVFQVQLPSGRNRS
ncbi:MAG: hypothetical protein Q9197_005971 [Variospora fuerteventurae]